MFSPTKEFQVWVFKFKDKNLFSELKLFLVQKVDFMTFVLFFKSFELQLFQIL